MRCYLLFMLLVFLAFQATAQETFTRPISDFKMRVQTSGKEIILTCPDGCAFKEVRFTNNPDAPQAIDYQGMTEVDSHRTSTHEDNPYFLFTILNTPEGIVLKGLKGTAWLELSFNCPAECDQYITEGGMTGE